MGLAAAHARRARLAEAEELLGSGELPLSRRAELLKTLAAGLEARDAYTHGHSNRVARYSEAIARAMGLSREQVAKVRTAAAVHDVGKIRTPREILTKPGRLDDAELAVMQRHVRDGAEMVAGLGPSRPPAPSPAHPAPTLAGRPPGGGGVQPTLSITPERVHVEAKVDLPQLSPLPPVQTNLTVDLPTLKLPRS